MKPFDNLTLQENRTLLKFPAYISMLAAGNDNTMDEDEKNAAIKLIHTKTFSCDPLLVNFYLDAEKVFESNIMQLERDLPKEKKSREAAIKKKLLILEKIVSKLGKKHVSIMKHSMKSFAEHVSKAHHSMFVDFIIPLPIHGLTK